MGWSLGGLEYVGVYQQVVLVITEAVIFSFFE